MKKISKILFSILILSLITISLYFAFREQENYLQGQIEAKQINVASKIPGRIEKIIVKEGDKVNKGDVLLTIETPEISAKLHQATAAQQAAQAQLNKANKGARTQQIKAIYNLWQQAKVAADFAESSFNRIDNLYKENLISAIKRDEAFTKYTAMKNQEAAAKAQYDLALEGAQKEDKDAAQALVERAKGAVNEVESYLKEANLYSPISAQVQRIIPNEGELVNTGYPIIQLIDLTKIWVVLHVREDFLNQFVKGSKFQAIIPALSNKIVEFEVNHIAVLGDFATWTATKSNGDFDRKTFEIKAYPTQPIENLYPGMSVLIKL